MNVEGAGASYRLSICGVDQLERFCHGGVSHVVSILDPGSDVPDVIRGFGQTQRLDLRFHDIIDHQEGLVSPQADHLRLLLQFGRAARSSELPGVFVVHCHAGVSRSTAAALLLFAQAQRIPDAQLAIRDLLEAQPNAWPNLRMVEIGDQLLNQGGSLVAAVRRHYADLVERNPQIRSLIKASRHLMDH
jgi:predicted protein tyrosine phosphatase